MTSWRVKISLGALSVGFTLLASCVSSGNDGPCDPYACDCDPACGPCPGGVVSSPSGNASSTCVGSPLCNKDTDCPDPLGDAVNPSCSLYADQVVNGYHGSCVLPCDSSEQCAQGRECISGTCKTVLVRVGNPCVQDADCDARDPSLQCIFTTCDEPGVCARPMSTLCAAGTPVCTCDGTTYDIACDAYPNAIAHQGPCETP